MKQRNTGRCREQYAVNLKHQFRRLLFFELIKNASITQPLTGFTHFVRGIFCVNRLSHCGSFEEGTPYPSRVKCDVRLRIRPYQTHIRRVTINGAGG